MSLLGGIRTLETGHTSHLINLTHVFFPLSIYLYWMYLYLPLVFLALKNNNNKSKSCHHLAVLGPWQEVTIASCHSTSVQAHYCHKPENSLVLWWHLVVSSVISSAYFATGVLPCGLQNPAQDKMWEGRNAGVLLPAIGPLPLRANVICLSEDPSHTLTLWL